MEIFPHRRQPPHAAAEVVGIGRQHRGIDRAGRSAADDRKGVGHILRQHVLQRAQHADLVGRARAAAGHDQSGCGSGPGGCVHHSERPTKSLFVRHTRSPEEGRRPESGTATARGDECPGFHVIPTQGDFLRGASGPRPRNVLTLPAEGNFIMSAPLNLHRHSRRHWRRLQQINQHRRRNAHQETPAAAVDVNAGQFQHRAFDIHRHPAARAEG